MPLSDASIPIGTPSATSQQMDAAERVVEGQTVVIERVQIIQAVQPVTDVRTASGLAAGASADLDGTAIGVGKTGKLLAVDMGSSAACKWEIKARDGGGAITKVILYTSGLAGQRPSDRWDAPSPDFVSLAYASGDENFRVTVTNLDAHNAADASVSMSWDET